jgi:hypothetical protein
LDNMRGMSWLKKKFKLRFAANNMKLLMLDSGRMMMENSDAARPHLP